MENKQGVVEKRIKPGIIRRRAKAEAEAPPAEAAPVAETPAEEVIAETVIEQPGDEQGFSGIANGEDDGSR